MILEVEEIEGVSSLSAIVTVFVAVAAKVLNLKLGFLEQ
jgi:hypothetical protein